MLVLQDCCRSSASAGSSDLSRFCSASPSTSSSPSQLGFFLQHPNIKPKPPQFCFRPRNRRCSSICFNLVEIEDIAVSLAHNKVLVAAGVSAAIGQLSKPFTSVLLYRKGSSFDFRSAFQAGGFPSTHSSAVVAAATCLALERGFADSIFGLTVVYAGLVMYDAQASQFPQPNLSFPSILYSVVFWVLNSASELQSMDLKQTAMDVLLHAMWLDSLVIVCVCVCVCVCLQGVRREVGSHAKVINRVLLLPPDLNSKPDDDEWQQKQKHKQKQKQVVTASTSTARSNQLQTTATTQALLSNDSSTTTKEISTICNPPLKESIGHTEIEVVGGAILGFLVSILVFDILS
ncbi:unnamed protein product [Linum tenue]|uniref:Acid phosphatase/vanadium-dependent haloperoxidase-related protein n=1 Tax=Linum tenue TaxID=586396 RepID=A0AAV0IRL3_9ROSI|nr:unnamed protein product [Linum tenue]